jgi:hypothetical protein
LQLLLDTKPGSTSARGLDRENYSPYCLYKGPTNEESMSEGSKQGNPIPQPQRAPTGPQAAAYARGAQARGVGPQKYVGARAGGPTPPIPPLDGPAPEHGKTMAQIAMEQRQQAAMPPGSILQGNQSIQQGPDIRPTDLLPAEAQSDPAFMHGSGSMYAISQPNLALKYGVMRGDKRLSPQVLMARPVVPGGPAKTQLRPETLEDLKKLSDLSHKGESGELAAERASEQGPAGQAANIGTPPGAGGGGKTLSDEEVKKKIAGMDEFDLSTLHEMMVRDIINNEDQRKIVEERCDPLNLADLVVNYTVTQRVPIIPGVFEPEYESLTGEDDLNLKRMLVEEAKTLKVDDRYLLDKYALLGLACAVKAINGKPLGSHRDTDGNFSEKALELKFKKILRMPLPMLAALGPHYFWFDQRVRKLFVAQSIKNG